MKTKLKKGFNNLTIVNINCYLFVLIIFGFSIFLLYINAITPLVGEDLILTPWNYGEVPISLIDKGNLVFHRVFMQASNWNARIGELLAIITSAFPKSVFNILNMIVINFLIVLLFAMGFGRLPNWNQKQDSVGIFIIIFLSICLNPLLGELFFWKSGTMNHTWGITFLLLFATPFRLHASNNFDFNLSKIQLILYVFVGFIAGYAIESACLIVAGLILIQLIWKIFRKQTIRIGFIIPFLTFSCGTLSFLCLPSTTIRRAYYASLDIYNGSSGIQLYLDRFRLILFDYINNSLPLLLILVFLLISWCYINRGMFKKSLITDVLFNFENHNFILIIIIFLSSLLTVVSLITIPYINDQKRGFAFNWYILFSIIAYVYMKIWMSIKNITIKNLVLSIVFLILVTNMFYISKSYLNFHNAFKTRNESINFQLANGKNELIIEPLRIQSSRILETREIYFINRANTLMKNYYGVNSISFQNKIVEIEEINFSPNEYLNIEKIEKNGNNLVISGWTFIDKINSNKIVIDVLLRNSEIGKDLVFSTSLIKRPDVAKYFDGPYIFTGFQALIPENELPTGLYQIGVVIELNKVAFGKLSETMITIPYK